MYIPLSLSKRFNRRYIFSLSYAETIAEYVNAMDMAFDDKSKNVFLDVTRANLHTVRCSEEAGGFPQVSTRAAWFSGLSYPGFLR